MSHSSGRGAGKRTVARALTALLLVPMLIAGALPARADDAVLGRSGETVIPLSDADIRMAAEEVVLTLEGFRTAADLSFTFTNDGPARTVLMGFPIVNLSPEAAGDPELHDFKAWVDGAPVEVKREAGGPAPGSSSPEYAAWITWSVSFAAGQTRVVRNTYWGSDMAWSNGDVRAGYILRTGAAWKGPIGHAVIRLRPNFLPVDAMRIQPADYRWDGNELVWEWRDFEPRTDIEAIWNNRPGGGDWETVTAAMERGVPAGAAAYLQEYRRSHPNLGAPDELDMVLALWLDQSGDQASAKAIVQRALDAGVENRYVAYLAVVAGLRQPADVLGWAMNPALRRWLQDRAGLQGQPPDLPVITFLGQSGNNVPWINVRLSDPDEDLIDWGVRVWTTPDEKQPPLIDARYDPADRGGLSRPDLMLHPPEPLTVDRVWARAWAADGRGHRRETSLVELAVPAAAMDPNARPAPDQSEPPPSPAPSPEPPAQQPPEPAEAEAPASPVSQLLLYALPTLLVGAGILLLVLRLRQSLRRRPPAP